MKLYIDYDRDQKNILGWQENTGGDCLLTRSVVRVDDEVLAERITNCWQYATVDDSDPNEISFQFLDDDAMEQSIAQKNLEALKQTAIGAINKVCEETIVSGFSSTALGSAHEYQSTRDDQINLAETVSSPIDRPVKCHIQGGEWQFINHSQAQRQQVLEDGINTKQLCLYHCFELKQQVESATTEQELIAIAVDFSGLA